MIKAAIRAVEYFLPQNLLNNTSLVAAFPDWSEEKIFAKTGITERRIADPKQCSSDLAYEAAKKLFDSGRCRPEDIDFVLLCTQSPDYFLPTTACILQDRLGIPTSAGALDFNLGCSGYIYGLSLAKGLIETAQAQRVLLLTAETYSKFIREDDISVRAIFGDGAAATLIEAVESEKELLGPFIFGSDGAGKNKLIVENGAARQPKGVESPRDFLFMDGPEIFAFTLNCVPRAINSLLEKTHQQLADIDMFVFHQANAYMLEHLRRKIKIDKDRFCVDLEFTGNTVSATIPIALSNLLHEGKIKSNDKLMLVGFGVGYSWAGCLYEVL